jgi:RsiW-degrading membrane proteinase PrsW (M82 family)
MIEVLFPAAFIPLIFLFIWVRNLEKYKRQSWTTIVIMFIWGSTLGAGIALFFNTMFHNLITSFLILSIVIAPIIEELSKALGLRLIKNHVVELEDGVIYGAVIGFGFAATENLLYGSMFWNEGLLVLLSLFYLRTIGSSLLHASATALAGYGYSIKTVRKKSILTVVPYILLAIGIHAVFNLFAFSALAIHQIFGVVTAVMFAFMLFIWIRRKIILLDKIRAEKETSIVD